MSAVGQITMQEIGDDRVYTDESGRSFTLRGRGDRPGLDIDPRIDLTKPIYEQAMKLMARDKAESVRSKKKRAIKAA